jgi:hypothetical protein
MTTGAWIMLISTWLVVGGFSIYLVAKVLTTPPRDEE